MPLFNRSDLAAKRPYLYLALAVMVLDQWSKWLVESRLVDRPPVTVIPGLLDFTYVRNTGVAFGLFPAGGNLTGTLILTGLGLAGFALITVYLLRTPIHHKLLLTSLALVLGGAVGNLADRIASGGVTDFVDFYWGRYHWYTFNVADSAITVGILLMTLEIFKPEGSAEATPAEGDGAAP